MLRRDMLAALGASALAKSAAAASTHFWMSPALPDGTLAEATVRSLPGKQPLICLTDRPPNYETPIHHFAAPITPNDAFFVRYHLAKVPSMENLGTWLLNIDGDAADHPLGLALDDLRTTFPQIEVAAVCQCAGNRRGLSIPHVPGVEWGYGAMGSALWRGPRLKDVLARAGVKRSAVEVWLGGADGPMLAATPRFQKSLPIGKALAEEVIIATSMNGQDLPHLNGYPARIVVPGWTATYWMKHVNVIRLSSKPLQDYWMRQEYRVPARMFPVDHPFTTQETRATWPVTEIVVNSLVAFPLDGMRLPRSGVAIEGVAWDRGHGIRRVEISLDSGRHWQPARLGKDLGPFAFRAFRFATGTLPAGDHVISSRAVSNAGETQPAKLAWNPGGYQNNVPQRIAVTVA